MARPPDPGIRARFRDQAADYVLSHGLGDLTLRPLARALKTNARMLVYHFGSREELMREILGCLREREDARIQAWFKAGKTARTLPQFLRWLWRRLATTRNRPAIRLLFELYALALRNPREYSGVLEDPLSYWQKLTGRAGVPANLNAVEATLLLAATRGLLLDFCATGDHSRVERAIEALAEFVEWRATSTK
jgi:AcrR family transcriptional regulator